jgi:hypothetical protein
MQIYFIASSHMAAKSDNFNPIIGNMLDKQNIRIGTIAAIDAFFTSTEFILIPIL